MQPASDSPTDEALKVITVQNQVQSPLLRLPAEIRNQIYKYILTTEGPIEICLTGKCSLITNQRGVHSKFYLHAHAPRHIVQVLEVCQQTYADAKFLVFSLNKIAGLDYLVRSFIFSHRLSSHQQAALRSLDIEIMVNGDDPKETMSCSDQMKVVDLAKLQGLEELVIRFFYLHAGEQQASEFASLLETTIKEAGSHDNKTIKVQVIARSLK